MKGDAGNYSSSTGIRQNCLRQTGKHGHPSYGELEPQWFVMVQTDCVDVFMSLCGFPVKWGSYSRRRGLREVWLASLLRYHAFLKRSPCQFIYSFIH